MNRRADERETAATAHRVPGCEPVREPSIADHVLALQRAVGNTAVGRAVRAGAIHPTRALIARQPVLAKNPLDDPAASKDAPSASKAIDAYLALTLPERRKAVQTSYNKDLILVLGALTPADQVKKYRNAIQEITRWVQEEETRASAGMTDDKIAETQKNFLKGKAEAAAKAEAAKKAPKAPVAPPSPAEVKKHLEKQVESTSIKKSTSAGWDALSAADKTAWETRAKAAVKKVVAHATAKHPELGITDAKFRIAFKDVEARGAGVVAFGEADGAGGTRAAVGFAFVTAVELNPAYVMDVVVHEVYGHPEYGVYGTEYHLALYDLAMAKMPGYAKPAAGTPARTTEIDAYAYQETEMYSVLLSMPNRTAPTGADVGKVPNLDTQTLVTYRVGLMKTQWAPTLIVPILRGYRKRLLIDPRIKAAAMTVFDNAVLAHFDAATVAAVRK